MVGIDIPIKTVWLEGWRETCTGHGVPKRYIMCMGEKIEAESLVSCSYTLIGHARDIFYDEDNSRHTTDAGYRRPATGKIYQLLLSTF